MFVECLYKDEVAWYDDYEVEWLYEGILAHLDNNNKDGFGVDLLLSHPLEYILEETLGGRFIVHHGYTNKIGWYETYVHLYCDHKY